MKVLIADDSEVIRDGIKTLLAEQLMITQVFEVGNGQAAIDFLKDKFCELVIVDISMPVMNGIEASKIIREELPEVKVLMVSMHMDKNQVKEAVSNKVHGYILKDRLHFFLKDALDAILKKDEKFYCDQIIKIVNKNSNSF